MSFRAQRVAKDGAAVAPFNWGVDQSPPSLSQRRGIFELAPPPVAPRVEIDPSAIEREAFTKGYAQGERAGAEAAATRGDAMLRRLAQTIDQVGGLRAEVVHRSERQLVQLAIAIAKRVIQREITLDRELLMAMARVALDRLGDTSSATIRLHPEDYTVALAARGTTLSTESVTVVPDPSVSRGGCLVESDFGLVDLTIDAQVDEITTALLGRENTTENVEAHVRVR